MADILSVSDYKTLRGITDAARDASLALGAAAATDAILQYTDRDFTTLEETATRKFPYDFSGILETDDFVSVSDVVLDGRSLVVDVDYFPGPSMGPGQTFYWLDLSLVRGASPAMGFTRNEDVLAREGFLTRRRRPVTQVSVTAAYGWPSSGPPASVKLAAAWLIDEAAPAFEAAATGHQAEAIADLSFVNASPEERSGPPVLPPRVISLLEPFRRLSV